jgi:hypothetical protein
MRERKINGLVPRVKIVSFFPHSLDRFNESEIAVRLRSLSLTHQTKNRYSEMKFEISKRTRRCAHRRAVVLNWQKRRVRVKNSSPFCYAFDVLAAHALSIY